jgi:hypothetical protein
LGGIVGVWTNLVTLVRVGHAVLVIFSAAGTKLQHQTEPASATAAGECSRQGRFSFRGERAKFGQGAPLS